MTGERIIIAATLAILTLFLTVVGYGAYQVEPVDKHTPVETCASWGWTKTPGCNA